LVKEKIGAFTELSTKKKISRKATKKLPNVEESIMSDAVLEELKLLRSDLTSQIKNLVTTLSYFNAIRTKDYKKLRVLYI